jgi:hypothetical protein
MMTDSNLGGNAIQQYHTDTLAVMPEDELSRALRRAQEALGRLRRTGGTSGLRRYAETEVCYLQRESEIRLRRRMAHERWLRTGRAGAPVNGA